jgi:hypothetical protein
MGIAANVPILPAEAVDPERHCASCTRSGCRESCGTMVAARVSASALARQRLFSHRDLKPA